MTRLGAALGGLLGRAAQVTGGRVGASVSFAAHLNGGAHGNGATVPGPTPHSSPRKAGLPDARREDDALDPLTRHAAQLAPPSMMAPPPAPPLAGPVVEPGGAPALRAMTSLEEILPQLVRRLSMTGDGRRGAIRVEIGAGALAGSTLLVSAEDGRLRVELSAPSTVDAESWRDRIATRLAARGLVVDDIVVKNA